jgi:hypothetical protein
MTPKGLLQLEGDVPLDTSIGAVDQLEHIKFIWAGVIFPARPDDGGGASFGTGDPEFGGVLSAYLPIQPLLGLLSSPTIVNNTIRY